MQTLSHQFAWHVMVKTFFQRQISYNWTSLSDANLIKMAMCTVIK